MSFAAGFALGLAVLPALFVAWWLAGGVAED